MTSVSDLDEQVRCRLAFFDVVRRVGLVVVIVVVIG